MKITNKHKLYFNVLLLFIFAYLLTSKILTGIKTNEFNYLRIIINAVVIFFTIQNINRYNVEE